MVFGNLFFMPLSPLIVLIHCILIIMSYCFKLNKVNRILRRNLRKVNRISYLLIKANHESPYSHHFLLIGLAIGYLTLLRSKGQLWLNTLFNLVVLLLAFFHFSLLFPFYLIPLLFSQQIDKINTPNQGSYEGLKTVLFVAVFQSIYLYLLLDSKSILFPWTHAASLVIGSLSIWVCLPLIKHLALRLALWCNHLAPWNYARFLNYATERMFLQRIGGRYRFIHKLQEHFAKMEL